MNTAPIGPGWFHVTMTYIDADGRRMMKIAERPEEFSVGVILTLVAHEGVQRGDALSYEKVDGKQTVVEVWYAVGLPLSVVY